MHNAFHMSRFHDFFPTWICSRLRTLVDKEGLNYVAGFSNGGSYMGMRGRYDGGIPFVIPNVRYF